MDTKGLITLHVQWGQAIKISLRTYEISFLPSGHAVPLQNFDKRRGQEYSHYQMLNPTIYTHAYSIADIFDGVKFTNASLFLNPHG